MQKAIEIKDAVLCIQFLPILSNSSPIATLKQKLA
jgi:hypothetical protein